MLFDVRKFCWVIFSWKGLRFERAEVLPHNIAQVNRDFAAVHGRMGGVAIGAVHLVVRHGHFAVVLRVGWAFADYFAAGISRAGQIHLRPLAAAAEERRRIDGFVIAHPAIAGAVALINGIRACLASLPLTAPLTSACAAAHAAAILPLTLTLT